MPRVAGSLRALLTNIIDYAGLFPPAALPFEIVAERYRGFQASPESWMLNRLVLTVGMLPKSGGNPDWRITLLADSDPGPLPPQVESIESKSVDFVSDRPVYYEAPVKEIVRGFAKIRTGGLAPEAIPSAETVARFLTEAAARRIPFKATAGLHHAIRSARALTYAADSPRAAMHGFLNVFAAAVLAWHGAEAALLVELLEDPNPDAFYFADDALLWRDVRMTTEQIAGARREFAHSFGSCSFEEPVSELRELGLLP